MKKTLLLFAAAVALVIMMSPKVSAAEFNFAAQAQIPENQLDKGVSYFDIKLDQGAEQTLHVDLRNDTEKEVAVDVEISSTTTNINGVVEYSPNEIKPAKSLKFNMKDYVKAPDTVKIPAKSATTLDLKAAMPNEKFDGVMAGGITLKEHQDTNDQANSSNQKGVSIKNQFSYVIGLVMQQNTNPVAPNVKLDDVKPTQINYRNVILAPLENDAATFINKVAVDAKISKKGSDKAIYTTSKDGLQMAPDATFDFPISLEGQELKPGEYVAQLEVYGNQNENGTITRKSSKGEQKFANHWTLTKEFTVKKKTADHLNKKDVSLKKENHWWVYVLIALLILLITVVAVLIFVVLKKKAEEKR